jgi:predicted nucleic acid-binding protein
VTGVDSWAGVVLDSWAVLAVLNDEPAAEAVDELMRSNRTVAMSWINLGEVFYIVQRRTDHKTAEETVRDLESAIDVVLPRRPQVLAAADIKARFAMSYADAFAAGLAVANDLELWTGDPELLIGGAPWSWRDLRRS